MVLRLMLLFLLSICGIGCQESQHDENTQNTDTLRPVKIQTVQLREQVAANRYSGEIRARYELPLAFQVDGKLNQRLVDVGSSVKIGQLLATLAAEDYKLNEASSLAQLRASQTELKLAQADLRHLSNLLQQNLSSSAAVDRRQDQVHAAEAKVQQAQAMMAQNTRRSAYTELRAANAGVITQALAEAGQVVTAGQPILYLARGGEHEVLIHVPENQLTELQQADNIKITLWAAPEYLYNGKVREISPGVDAVTRTFSVRITILNADAALHLGLTTTVQVEHHDAQALAHLPLTALGSYQSKPAVWLLAADNTVQPREVQIHSYQSDSVTLSSGVKEGDRLVVAGVHKLLPDQKVRLLEQAAP